jgi:predicted RNA polymerase sigma factor
MLRRFGREAEAAIAYGAAIALTNNLAEAWVSGAVGPSATP